MISHAQTIVETTTAAVDPAVDARIWLGLAAAGLSALAAMSPEARAAIDASLDETLSLTNAADSSGQVFAWLRERITPGAHDTLAQQLEDAIVAKADALSAADPVHLVATPCAVAR